MACMSNVQMRYIGLSCSVLRQGQTWMKPEPKQEADSSPGQLAHWEQGIQHHEGRLID